MGNGIGNIIAALIVSGSILGATAMNNQQKQKTVSDETSQEEYKDWLARAVGDIRNDIVINCGCCGDEGTPVKGGAKRTPTRSF